MLFYRIYMQIVAFSSCLYSLRLIRDSPLRLLSSVAHPRPFSQASRPLDGKFVVVYSQRVLFLELVTLSLQFKVCRFCIQQSCMLKRVSMQKTREAGTFTNWLWCREQFPYFTPTSGRETCERKWVFTKRVQSWHVYTRIISLTLFSGLAAN